jgi:hypothetical protein
MVARDKYVSLKDEWINHGEIIYESQEGIVIEGKKSS